VALEPDPSTSPLVVVVHDDPGTADSLRHAVEAATGWPAGVADPSPAGLAAALAGGVAVALVGCGALASLPEDCRVPVIAVGDDERPADVRAALAAGARSLLAWPDGAADLLGELKRVALTGEPAPPPGPSGLVVATRGVQGGAGTTTVAVHLAAAWARWGPTPVLLLDLAGGLAFRLDLGAVPTWANLVALAATPAGEDDPFDTLAYEPPVRVGGRSDGPAPALSAPAGTGGRLDAATLAGTLAEPWAGLFVLPLAGLADGLPEPPPDPRVVQHVLELARTTCRVVVLDLPATDGPLIDPVLSRADTLVAVGRCETAGVRGLQAAIDGWTATGHDPDTAGAVVTGVRPQAPLAPREVRAALGDRLWALVPTAAAELAAAAEDGVLLLDRHDLAAVQAMVTLANRVLPFAAVPA
jgi:cellulose biosynthesis protein BcsQ